MLYILAGLGFGIAALLNARRMRLQGPVRKPFGVAGVLNAISSILFLSLVLFRIWKHY